MTKPPELTEATKPLENEAAFSNSRFFIDHGMIHDRVTGKHVDPTPVEIGEDQFDASPVQEVCDLLNSLAARTPPVTEPSARLIEAVRRMILVNNDDPTETDWDAITDELDAAYRDFLTQSKGMSHAGQ